MMIERRALLSGLGGILGCALCGAGKGFASEALHWSYSGPTGPEHWGELDHAAQVCSIGGQQSPIDIVASTRSDLPAVELAWNPLAGKVVNNGHTIQVDVASGGTMAVGPAHYDLLQFHFHAPSEHRIDGRSFPMEVHFVHRDAQSGSLGVLGVFVVAGRPNPAFKALMAARPEQPGSAVPVPPGTDMTALLPAGRRYYAYEGSLTTPPCSETVDWRVCVDPIEVDAEDIRRFTALYPMNARPVQERHRRFVLVSG
ncbi:Carbonate dehydratase [Methylobacterium sp. 4-46]|uniref:carbonic anhydrase n=1 Tax=unclassified Methylobacterium TaxID=2615210 RepID=UPI000165C647|nr:MULTISPECIES: carbonic anhydrase family protein [Methylobacterium]ACA17099.1 Carbonate dehydratase [Methylobacterium sp. 4-46]WFT82784.1 carbonic anhydrase family protein [Methylobacterium nodulans]